MTTKLQASCVIDNPSNMWPLVEESLTVARGCLVDSLHCTLVLLTSFMASSNDYNAARVLCY